MQSILDYLKTAYSPLAIVTYGSYENVTQDEYSDFDCMIIGEIIDEGRMFDL